MPRMNVMRDVNLAGVDLNLLVALEALLEQRSVTRAGAQVGLAQPAMSHALRRLRALLDDPLFVRTSRGLQPTPRAEALEPLLREALGVVRVVLAPTTFEPATYRGPIRLSAVDYQSFQLLPSMLARLAAEAPLIDLEVVVADSDAPEQILSGRSDIALAGAVDGSDLRQVRLFEDDFVCVVRTGHPVEALGLTLQRFAELDHCFLTITGRGGGAVDTALAAVGLQRRVVLRLPHFLAAPLIVAESDLILTVPRLLAERLARLAPLTVMELPFTLKGYELNLLWHERVDKDPAHVWLRQLIRDCVKSLWTA